MTELTIDSYFTKLNELETLCSNPLTTSTLLNTYIGYLGAINDTLETEMDTLPFPTTTQHLRKLILLELERNDNSFIQSNLLKLIKIKEAYAHSYVQANYPISGLPDADYTDRNSFSMAYSAEIKDVITTVHNINNNCSCMKNRKYIIENIKKI